jgi:hypothetical protein
MVKKIKHKTNKIVHKVAHKSLYHKTIAYISCPVRMTAVCSFISNHF